MRHKDETKSEAIFQATIELLNEIGFSDISISKIAKRANVSPATLYIHFENKEDMLAKLYFRVKEKMSRQLIVNLDESMSMEQLIGAMMRNLLHFVMDHREDFLFMEQISNSPLFDKLCLDDTKWMFKPLLAYIEQGIQNGTLKQIHTFQLLSYCYFPVTLLAKEYFKGRAEITEQAVQDMIRMSWDAVRA
ncbi:TetR/AcrR family transcriptional regulator [Paenibacillus sp. y28]|uniref:TetR/AcrR family transcriptional regulator n=1 Tax=Paenibacillus sp. y28 TaxID=3129110 RepID=UPI003015B87D